MARTKQRGSVALMLIAAVHIVKGLALCAVTLGAITLFHKDVSAHVEHWIDLLRLDPDNAYIGGLLEKVNLVQTRQLKEISALTGVYAALFLIQGTGLAFRQRWAEWLTIVGTSLFIPLEVYKMVQEFTVVRSLLLVTNIAVVAFLVWLLRQKR